MWDTGLTRHTFVKHAIAGLAVVAATDRYTAAEPQWKMQLSTSSIQFTSLALEDACKRIGKPGFEAIDLWDSLFGTKHLGEASERRGAGKLAALLKEHDLKPNAFTVYREGHTRRTVT